VVADSILDKVYVLRTSGNGIVVVDPRTLAWRVIDTAGAAPTAMAIDPETRRMFVTFAGAGEVRTYDPAGTLLAAARVGGQPGPIAWSDGGVYVLTEDSTASIVFLHGTTLARRTFSIPGWGFLPRAIVATSSIVYAGFAEGVVLLDTKSSNVTTVKTGAVLSLFADNIGGQAFVIDSDRVLTSIRGADKHLDRTPIPHAASAVAFIYKSNAALVTGAALSIVHAPSSDFGVAGIDAQGLWWALGGTESGWGLNIAHQGTKLFATWFTYDAQGRNTWLVMSDTLDVSRNGYEGTLYRTTGPAFGEPFDPARVTRTPVGKLQIAVQNTDNATLTATVDGVTVRKTLSQQQFALPMPICAKGATPGSIPNYQDLWWNSSESGWGLNIAHQGDILFVTWFTYDGDGRPMWLVGSNVAKTGNATFAGTLFRTAGPPLAASPWDPARVSRMPAGTITLTFADNDNGTIAYSVDGVSRTKSITRQRFASPATSCR
jgi:hypothetical protein